ncbi:translin [Methanofervidicoccus abyssi]|uniref:Translin n=2 Tax=Methanofervidicoccus abyssi TaxID=2082189 RepID=A0A401HP14_9EURY|nr:translin [Methanofervidicoccus abyssi]
MVYKIFGEVMGKIDLLEYFEKKDSTREEILKIAREIVRNCAMNIRHVQKMKKEEISFEVIDKLKKLEELTKEYYDFGKYLNLPQQEYVEFQIFYSIVFEDKYLEYHELEVEVKPENYVLGICDVVGELRRMILESIKNDDIKNAEKYYRFMEKIYDEIIRYDYYHVIEGLRKKQDICRGILEKTYGDLVTFVENLKLREELGKHRD